MPDEELNSLERVRQRLYSANAVTTFEAPTLDEHAPERARGWDKLKQEPLAPRKEASHISGPARFFIIAVLFFLITGGGAAFYLLYGGRVISSNNVNITVQGPTSIASGDTVPLLLTIENRNPVAIQATRVTIDFPDGTKSADNPNVPFVHTTEDIGTIASGGKVEKTIRAAVYGSEGQDVTLPIKIEYRTEGSTSVFIKNKQYSFTITSSPISLTVTSLSQASAGQPVTIDVTVRSNATTPLNSVAVAGKYPFGFTPTRSAPQPTSGSLFYLGVLTPGEERRISITGIVSGEANDDRAFTFMAGTVKNEAATTLATSFTTKGTTIKLTRPFLATALSINRDTSESPVIDVGVPTQAIVTWTNTLSTPITNARISVALMGDALNRASVTSSGFYRSSDTTVLFDSSTNPALATLQPGDSGQGTLTFTAKRGAVSGQAPTITFNVAVVGQRLSETRVPETLSATLTRTVKVATNLSLTSRAVRTTGPFKNTGPWPPEANKESTYTVTYTLANAGNTVAGTQVLATLPSYVRFTGAISPTDGSLKYNDTTRTLTWSAGDITSSASRNVSFQVALTPSTSQQDTSPILVNTQQVSGVDRFTQKPVSASARELTTQVATDPAYTGAFGTVK